MKTLFPLANEKQITLPNGINLIIPGGMLVPESYGYINTGDFLIERCLAAWETSGGDGLPLDFRLVGPPGVGKNATVYALAAKRQQPLYVLLGHEELTSEDLVLAATLGSNGEVKYVASPLLAAMIEGGICFIDEIAKMRPRALAPLSSVLDQRRSINSAILGHTFNANEKFRFCAAYNPTDADAFDLAPWLRRRTLPEFEVNPPDLGTLEKIVRLHDRGSASLWMQVSEHIQKIPIEKRPNIDAGTAVRLLTFIRRLENFQTDNSIHLGDATLIAIRHILGVGIVSQK